MSPSDANPGLRRDDDEAGVPANPVLDAAFRRLVESVGVKRFASGLGITTRQVNRMLSGAQPNPVERFVRCLQASLPEAGDSVLDVVCHELGGSFVRHESTLDTASSNAVRECAEAIAAISDGDVSELDRLAIRDAIAALMALNRIAQKSGRAGTGSAPANGSRPGSGADDRAAG